MFPESYSGWYRCPIYDLAFSNPGYSFVLGIHSPGHSTVLGISQPWAFYNPGHPTVSAWFLQKSLHELLLLFSQHSLSLQPHFPLDGHVEGSRTGAVALQQSACPACAEALGSLPRTETADFTMCPFVFYVPSFLLGSLSALQAAVSQTQWHLGQGMVVIWLQGS